VDEGKAQQVCCATDLGHTSQERARDHRKKYVGRDKVNANAAPVLHDFGVDARAIFSVRITRHPTNSYGYVSVSVLKIDCVYRCRQADVQIGVSLYKACQAGHQPACAKGWQHADCQHRAARHAHRSLGGAVNVPQRPLYVQVVVAPHRSELYPPGKSVKQFLTKHVFEQSNLAADGTLRDVQFRSSERERKISGGRLERAKND